MKRYYAVYTPAPEHMWVPGIPARDLSAEEVQKYGVGALRNSQCYELVEIVEPVEEPEPEESDDGS